MGIIRSAVVLLAAVSLLAGAGCSDSEPGKPKAGDTTTAKTDETTETSETSDESAESSESEEPTGERPKPLDMASVDVCQLLTKLPVTSWGLDGRAPVGDESSSFPGAQTCVSSGVAANLGLGLTAVTDEGVADYVESTTAQPTESQAKGYRLVVLTPASQEDCFGVVDVNDGQLLHISYGMNIPGEAPVTAQATLCERVPAIAEAALTALGA